MRLVLICFAAWTAGAQQPSDVVNWSASVPSYQTVSAGMPFIASLTARIEEGWHVYAISQPPGGPKALAVRVAPGQFVHLEGTVAGPKPRSVSGQGIARNR